MAMATAVGIATFGLGTGLGFARVAGWIGVVVLSLRAIGDGRFIGFTKSIRATPFSRADDLAYTPIVVVLAVGSAGGLLAAA